MTMKMGLSNLSAVAAGWTVKAVPMTYRGTMGRRFIVVGPGGTPQHRSLLCALREVLCKAGAPVEPRRKKSGATTVAVATTAAAAADGAENEANVCAAMQGPVSSQAGCVACARLSRQVDDMTRFLADHGLTWVPTTNVAQDTGHDSVRDGRRGDGFPSVSSGTPVAKEMCCPASPAVVVVEIDKHFIETFQTK